MEDIGPTIINWEKRQIGQASDPRNYEPENTLEI